MIYLSTDGLDLFDPVYDLLVEEDEYLTWRHINQEAAPHANVYAGANYESKNWLVHRLNPDLYYQGVERWLTANLYLTPGPHLGMYRHSEYNQLLGHLYPARVWDDRIDKARKFADLHLHLPDGWDWPPLEEGSDSSHHNWWEVVQPALVQGLLTARFSPPSA